MHKQVAVARLTGRVLAEIPQQFRPRRLGGCLRGKTGCENHLDCEAVRLPEARHNKQATTEGAGVEDAHELARLGQGYEGLADAGAWAASFCSSG